MTVYDGIEYTITPGNVWGYFSTAVEYQRAEVSPDPYYPHEASYPARDMYVAFRCTFCHAEYPVNMKNVIRDIQRRRYSNHEIDMASAEASQCHPRCDHCSLLSDECEGHTYCDHCDTYDCELTDEEHVYCDICERMNCGRSHAIHDYSYKPRPKWLTANREDFQNTPYFLGFELEVTSYSENRDARRILDWTNEHIGMDSVYMKHDGSVEGFEIVSHPMTPEFFESIDWRGFMSQIRQNDNGDTRSEPTNHGLHVHVSRTAFTNQLTLARWIYLWNARVNRTRAIELCRRQSDNWAAFKPQDVGQIARALKEEKRAAADEERALRTGSSLDNGWQRRRFYPDFQRYSLINLTNHDTVEFRGFRSTRRADHFRRSIRSVYQSVDYVRNMQPWHATTGEYSLARATADIGS